MKYSELKTELLDGLRERPHSHDLAFMSIRLNNHREEHFDKLLEACKATMNIISQNRALGLNQGSEYVFILDKAKEAIEAAQTVKEL